MLFPYWPQKVLVLQDIFSHPIEQKKWLKFTGTGASSAGSCEQFLLGA